jgi:predicted DNA-binding transcriptional regulator
MKQLVNPETIRLYDAACVALYKRGAMHQSNSDRAWRGYDLAIAKLERAVETLDAALSKAKTK